MLQSDIELHRRQRRKVWMGLGAAVVLGTVAQLCWKAAAGGVSADPSAAHTLWQTFSRPLFWVAIALFVAQFFNWMIVLTHADLSYAQPLTALSYVTVSISASILFSEHVPPGVWAGIGLILLGVWFISRGGHRTPPHPAPAASAATALQEAAL